tara:strand:- start:7489 stop:7893 length:405 start_codon:yes stop_codon:yes gene_type:complete
MALTSRDLSRNYPALKYFKSSEFDSPDDIGSGDNMCPVFMQKLDAARGRAKIPFRINSGYRTPKHNSEVGGVKHSSHMNIPCEAADIHIKDSTSRFLIIVSLMAQGFTRFGIGKNFIHVDGDIKKSQNLIWHYY